MVDPLVMAAVRAAVDRARSDGRSVLPEDAALDLVERAGIPTVRRARVPAYAGPQAVSIAAAAIGFPVVIKGLARDTSHKTEGGLVMTGLGDEAAVARAAASLAAAGSGAGLEWILIEEHVPTLREMATGLVRDPVFGPSVMIGFGGVHAEIVGDMAFRVAPFVEADAIEAMESLRCAPMLGAYRGSSPADLPAIARIMVAIGEIGTCVPGIAEMDLNPLVILPSGAPVAASALAVIEQGH